MLAGDLYIADDPELARDNLWAMALMERFNGSSAADSGCVGVSSTTCSEISAKDRRSDRPFIAIMAIRFTSGPGHS